MRRLILATLIFALAVPCGARPKKLIEYGWDVPDTAYMREHIAEMEKVPLDGVVFKVRPSSKFASRQELGWRSFSKERFDYADLEEALADLKATKFTRFKDNFIQLTVSPAGVDWFDPAWSNASHNAAVLARLAKESGCKGIMFDPEPYGGQLWGYHEWPKEWTAKHTFEEYAKKVRERGREFMEAINAEYPDVTMLCLFGPSMGTTLWASEKPENNAWGMLRYFFQGMLDAASPQTVIVDGWEAAYSYRNRQQFVDARKTILQDTVKFYDDPRKFAKHIRCGFGIWTDLDWRGFGWSYTDFTKNYHSPAGFRASLAYAMELSDEYVWVYSEELRWWNPARAPEAYIEALALAKKGPGPGEPNPAQGQPPVASKQKGYSDDETFAEMRKTMTEVFDLPKDGWRWARDPEGTGIVKGWHKPGFDDSAWKTLSISKFWEEQGERDYDGCAWYRASFQPPAIEPGKRVHLAFGAADETAMVWLNGHYVGKYDVGPDGWDDAFCLDVTGVLKPGEANRLAVRVCDTVGPGGLWKSVKVMAK